MAAPILMPQVGQDLTEGVLVSWNVKVGDPVKKGDIVAVVESEKASFEVEAFEEGTVLKLLYGEGDKATVLEPILFVGAEGESLDGNTADAAKAEEKAPAPESAAPAETAEPAPASSGGTSSSPLARRLAKQNGLDITAIAGTGPRGSVVKRDIEAALASGAAKAPATEQPAAAPAPAPAAPAAKPMPLPAADTSDREEPFTRMRQVIADRLLLSKQTIPHFYLKAEVDVSDLLIRRRAHLDMGGDKVSLNDVIVHATALTLLEFPRLNAHVASDRVVLKGQVNVGVAVSVENGLMVPAIENTPFMSLAEIAASVREHAAAARRGMTKSQAQSTFSISNLGMYGVEVIPIINPPEAGILGVGPIQRQVREHRGGIQVRDILPLSLAADHRAVDGAYGAQFLQALSETISTYNMFDGKLSAAAE
ncbi:dihydrolipoamide acetyltransferase family protein [Rhodobium gokarnense]|uniref:Dihydrolipoamide acetyltransferase component of pyruvate dehydrogenase complex n=1 Tax=Rhodobium gokarnense TaxID=364296 RepID=A0ABT3H899_9HYPH|nr:dihydrolipoamide acetyltransferase family protein [Rhodobium gokarnense]MCW2306593.1 pyruvate dehydrogenase E2 component (dihydrolipoamide acetyltransferase) [Rhodobium gokarnense]